MSGGGKGLKLGIMISQRPATLEDIPLIRQLAGVAFPATYAHLLSQEQLDYMMDWMYSEESLKAQMTGGHSYFIAQLDGQDCGYVSVEQEGEHQFHLQKIYVLPEFQGRKVGEFLFQFVVDYVSKLHPGPCELRLNVNRYNKAVTFYKHMGMHQVDEGDFPIGHGFYMTDYIMGLDLNQ